MKKMFPQSKFEWMKTLPSVEEKKKLVRMTVKGALETFGGRYLYPDRDARLNSVPKQNISF